MKGQAFVIGIVVFTGALCSGCQNASGDMKILLHDHPEQRFRYSETPIKRVVAWYFTDDPGGHLRIYWSGHEEESSDLQLSREAIEQVAKCSVENLGCSVLQRQVVSEDEEEEFPAPCLITAAAQSRAEAAFDHREAGFRLPALPVAAVVLVQPPLHLSSSMPHGGRAAAVLS